MIVNKIGGNWHKLESWEDYIIGYKSGGINIIRDDGGEIFIPFYDFHDFQIKGNYLYLKNRQIKCYKLNLLKLNKLSIKNSDIPLEESSYYPMSSKRAGNILKPSNLLEEPRAIDSNGYLIAIAYRQKGIDLLNSVTLEKLCHFNFPGYSFVDDIKFWNKKVYIADVFGLRILNITDPHHPVLDDRFTRHKGWPKDIAVHQNYVLVADVLGIKIYDKSQDFTLIGKIESNKNRIAKIAIKDKYAFLSCEANGLKIADISDIKNPKIISGLILSKGVWDSDVFKDHIYLASFTQGLLKVDYSHIKNLALIRRYNDSREIIGIHVNEKAVYAACSYSGFMIFDHELNPISSINNINGRCWAVVENNGYLYVSAGKAGVMIYSINDLYQPEFFTRLETQEARDLCITENCLYVASGQNGVAIYDIGNIGNIRLIRRIPSAAFTRGVMVDQDYIYKGDGDGGLEVYKKH